MSFLRDGRPPERGLDAARSRRGALPAEGRGRGGPRLEKTGGRAEAEALPRSGGVRRRVRTIEVLSVTAAGHAATCCAACVAAPCRKSAARCACAAAVKMARVSALRTV